MQLLKHWRNFGLIPLTLLLGFALTQVKNEQIFAQTTSTTVATEKCTATAIETWINQLKEGNTDAFDKLVACSSKAVPALIKAMNHEDETTRLVSIAILGEIGTEATEAIPILEKVLEVRTLIKYRDELIVAVNALGKMGEAAVPALITALENKYLLVRTEAAEVLELKKLADTQEDSFRFRKGYKKRGGIRRRRRRRVRRVARSIVYYRRNNPPVMCQYPVIKAILPWKCPQTETAITETTPKPSNTTSPRQPQPVKK